MKKTSIGGQALIEGIIMRGPSKSCTVIRKPDGSLDKTEKTHKNSKNILKKLPFFRGVYNLFFSLKEGSEALTYSATVSGFEDEEVYSKFELWLIEKFGDKKIEKFLLGFSTVLAILISIGLFILTPTLVASLMNKYTDNNIIKNLFEGLVRIIIFVGYLYLVSKMEDIKRTYMYHGAEHKTIFCYEKGLDLTVENVRNMPKEHPRCGTSFLFVVMIISILVFSIFTWTNPLQRVILRLVLIPVVVGISYEINRFVGKIDNIFTNLLRLPGLKLQKLTTLEPSDDMIEVAIEALKEVIPVESGSDEW